VESLHGREDSEELGIEGRVIILELILGKEWGEEGDAD
jgi:hypothetical protein